MPGDGPKTAYELAMERLRQKDRESSVEERPRTDAQKASLAEVRKGYQAKVAEREILHRDAPRRARRARYDQNLGEASVGCRGNVVVLVSVSGSRAGPDAIVRPERFPGRH